MCAEANKIRFLLAKKVPLIQGTIFIYLEKCRQITC